MEKYKMGEKGQKFANIIWDNEPIGSRELTQICTDLLEWKRTTTYTMLKTLCDKQIFINTNGVVTSLISKNDYELNKGSEFINDSFQGSLPKFITAFTHKNKLSDADINEIQKIIDAHKEDKL